MDRSIFAAKEIASDVMKKISNNTFRLSIEPQKIRNTQKLRLAFCRWLESPWLAQSGPASSTCGFGKTMSYPLGFWSAYECPFVFNAHLSFY